MVGDLGRGRVRADHPDRHPAADRRRRADRRGRRVLAVAHPGARLLLDRPVPRPDDHGVRARRRCSSACRPPPTPGVPPSLAGLAGALINASFQVGAALGLAIFSALATSRTQLAAGGARGAGRGAHRRVPPGAAAGSIFLVAAAVIALRAANTRGEPTTEISGVAVTMPPRMPPDRVRDAAPLPGGGVAGACPRALAAAPRPPALIRAGHASHSRGLCIRRDHFSGRGDRSQVVTQYAKWRCAPIPNAKCGRGRLALVTWVTFVGFADVATTLRVE